MNPWATFIDPAPAIAAALRLHPPLDALPKPPTREKQRRLAEFDAGRQWRRAQVLRLLTERDMHTPELAVALECSGEGLRTLLGRMRAAGLVAEAGWQVVNRGRASVWTLTDAGRAAAQGAT